MGSKKRYIKSFTDIGLDITVVEILDENNISKGYFLFPELESVINDKLINNTTVCERERINECKRYNKRNR